MSRTRLGRHLAWTVGLSVGAMACGGDDGDGPTGPLLVDAQPPIVLIQSPTTDPGFVTIEETVAITGVAADDENLVRVEWSSDRGGSGVATGTTEWEISDIAVELGDNVITITAVDSAGNEGRDEITVTRNETLVFRAPPSLERSTLLTNEAADLRVQVEILPNPDLIENSVRLIEVDENGAEVRELGPLFDNGDLANGDEILADNVFSGIFTFAEGTPQEIRLRVVATTLEPTGEVEGLSSVSVLRVFDEIPEQDLDAVLSTQDDAAEVLEELIDQFFAGGGTDINEVLDQLVDELLAQPEVASATATGSTSIQIEYASGLLGGLFLNQTDPDAGDTRGGAFLTAVQGSQGAVRPSGPALPTAQQTVGTLDRDARRVHRAGGAQGGDLVLNKKVLIYAPYEAAFAPHNEGPALVQAFEDSDLTFDVTYLTNQAASVSALESLTDYGTVILATHGSGGEAFATGEVVTSANRESYQSLLVERKIGIWTNVTIDASGDVERNEDVYVVYSDFIAGASGSFPSSLIINNSCESTQTPNLRAAFLGKGAQTYFGYDAVVGSRFAVEMAADIIGDMAVDLVTAGTAFTPNQQDPSFENATFEIFGNEDLHYPSEFINGDFELGSITGWTKAGDGRVITGLASLEPTQGSFMGIISTGLGFTVTSGAISQSFRINQGQTQLTVTWNFLSEEFLEFVGSEFQDFFRITIRGPDGQQTVLFEKAIDDFDAEYTLVAVSPEIVFDQGDVHMTDWQTTTLDVSAFQGQIVTLEFEAGDIGDSIFDSAVLLDEIAID